jgi:diaminohydroxyphosphoribosylaminopyrimidine deaminase/5-amino-6-(5-phosphoribosylamino)uracil reductase
MRVEYQDRSMAKTRQNTVQKDELFMQRALDLANFPSHCLLPNPRVGAVIVSDGSIVGEGCHQGPGQPHAEVMAIRSAQSRGIQNFANTEIYVTLEPCSHTNKRTPPCAPLLIEKKFKRVIISHMDPNPQVSGNGIELIRKAGIQVDIGPLREAAEAINQPFLKNQTKKMPYITLKLATTFDGKMHDDFSKSKWITGSAARDDVQQLRSKADAVAVGRKTIDADNPHLNCRIAGNTQPKKIVIFGTPKKLKNSLNVVRANGQENIFWISKSTPLKKQLKRLFLDHHLHHLVVEGGPTVAGYLLDQGLVDEVVLYLGRGFLGGQGRGSLKIGEGLKRLEKSISFVPREAKILSPDIRIQGFLNVYRTH